MDRKWRDSTTEEGFSDLLIRTFNCTFLRRFCDCSRVFERFESVVVGSDLEIGFGEFERLWGSWLWGMNEMMFRMMFEEFIFEFDLEERMG